jgi:O-antigen ligase
MAAHAIEGPSPIRIDAPSRARVAGRASVSVAILVLLGVGLAELLSSGAPSLPIILGGGCGLLGVLALAIARYEWAVAFGFLLFGIVKVEPAPPDGVFAVIIAVALVSGRFRLSRVPLIASCLVGMLIALNVLSSMEIIDKAAAVRFFGITFYLAVFSLWFASYIDSTQRARTVVICYLIIALITAAIGVAAVNLPIPMRHFFLGDGSTRADALFKDPNVYGPFLVPIAVILLEERITPKLLRLRPWVNGAMLGLLALGILFSFSRAAWLNFTVANIVMLTVLTLRRGGGRRALRVLTSLFLLAMVVVVVIGATGSLAFIQKRAQLQGYDSSRFAAQADGVKLSQEYPIGVGPGQFHSHYPVETHSTYVRVLVEQGFLGLITWLALVISTIIMGARNALYGRSTYGIGSAALLGSWCGVLANSAVVDTLHWRHLWFIAALIWAGAMTRRLSESERVSERARPAIAKLRAVRQG